MKRVWFIIILSFILLDLYSQDPVYIVRDTTTDHSQRRIYPAPTFTMGVVDDKGETIIPFIYEDIKRLTDGIAIVKKFEKYGVIDSLGNQVVPFVFDELETFIKGRAVAHLHNKWGIVDTQGKEIIPFIYDEILYFTGNNAFVKQDGKYAVIAIDQQIISPFLYDNVEPFGEGIAVVEKYKKRTIVDTLGNEQGKYMYDWIYPCQQDILVTVENGKYGILYRDGGQMSSFDYTEISPFNKKKVGMVSKNSKYGIINTIGYEAVPLIYDEMTLYDDCAAVKLDHLWGVVDFMNDSIIPIKYQSIKRFYGDLFLVKRNDRWHFFNTKTKEERLYAMESINSRATYQNGMFSEYQHVYSVARRDGKWGLIDSLGNIAAPFIFEGQRIVPLTDNMLGIWKRGKMALADFKGKLLSEYNYNEAFTLSGELIRVNREGKFGVVDNTGNVLLFCEYDGIYPLVKDNFYTIYKNGSYGVINDKGQEVVPVRYAAIIPFTHKTFIVRR